MADGVPKMGNPQARWMVDFLENLQMADDWGYHYSRKPPNGHGYFTLTHRPLF